MGKTAADNFDNVEFLSIGFCGHMVRHTTTAYASFSTASVRARQRPSGLDSVRPANQLKKWGRCNLDLWLATWRAQPANYSQEFSKPAKLCNVGRSL